MPSAAHTPLKFTPAAITRTTTSTARLGDLDLLEPEGLQRLALALLADHPGGHRGGQLARLDVELRDLTDVGGHGRSRLRRLQSGADDTQVRRRARLDPGDARVRSSGTGRGEALRPDRRRRLHLPFPNDFFTDQGRRAPRRLAARAPSLRRRRVAERRIDPRERNRADGFSLGQQVTVWIPGLDSQAALDASGIVPITDIVPSLERRQPVVLIDARSGEREPIWAELDSSAPRVVARADDPPGEEPARGAPLRRRLAQAAHARAAAGSGRTPCSARCATASRRAAAGAPSMRRVFRRWRVRASRAATSSGPGLHCRQPRSRRRWPMLHMARQRSRRWGISTSRSASPRAARRRPRSRATDAASADRARDRARASRARSRPRPAPPELGLRGRQGASTAVPTGSRHRSRAIPTPPSSAVSSRATPAGGGGRGARRPRPARQPADSSDFAQAQLRDARARARLHRLRHLLERALGSERG